MFSDGHSYSNSAVFLTAAHPRLTNGPDILAGPSLDQIVAARIAGDTRLPSLQLCIENLNSLAGDCGHGYSCAYANTISWASPTEPLPMERAPRALFERLFSDPARRGSARPSPGGSILDGLDEEAGHLRRRLGPADRNRLHEYLEEVRAVEQQIHGVEKDNSTKSQRTSADEPLSIPESFEEHVRLMLQLLVLAFRADVTRVCTFKMGVDRSSRIYPESGVTTAFHALSHHRENPEKIAEFARLNQYHVSRVAEFLGSLHSAQDGEGNLLDHAVVLYGSPMGDSHIHEHKYLPVFIAGDANGRVKGDTHVRCAPGTPMANVLLTLARRLGVDLDRIGDSTGEIQI